MSSSGLGSGQTASSNTIDNGDYVTVPSGGTASGTTINNGFLEVDSGESDVNTTVNSSGYLEVTGGADQNSTINSGGYLVITMGGTATGDILNAASTAVVMSGSLINPTISAGAYAAIYPASSVVDPTLLPGSVLGLLGVSYAAGGTAVLDSTTDVLTMTEGGTTTLLQLAGSYTGDSFSLSPDDYIGTAAMGSVVTGTDVLVNGPACYCRGTRIATPKGEVAIETLAIGDLVLTADGRIEPIRWIGRRSYAGRFLAANPKVHPIRLRSGSLGNGRPRRDLWVSPEHALYLDDLLVPAHHLVNGTSITRDSTWESVDYIHLELENHDIILAEGAPAETFMDDASRGMFANAAEYGAIYPDALPPSGFYARRVGDGYELEAIRQRLAPIGCALAA